MRSTFTLSFLAAALCLSPFALAQETVAEIDFDSSEAKYLFSYAFGGYGSPDGSESISIQEQVKVEHSLETSGGVASKGDEKKPSGCLVAKFDSSKMKIPADASYEYAGVGVGACFDFSGKKLDDFDPADYSISFDVKSEGTETLTSSKFMLSFVTDDGDDEDTNDDVIMRLARGEDDGTNTFVVFPKFKNYTFDLSDMKSLTGEPKDLQDANITGIAFTVQAQGEGVDFGTDTDNKIYIDNLRLIKKK